MQVVSYPDERRDGQMDVRTDGGRNGRRPDGRMEGLTERRDGATREGRVKEGWR